ncbi:MAG: hypothetical protein ACP6IQ_07110, partial [Candidatus Njordarchaeia archaeon]
NSSDAGLDNDGDGLTNLEEYQHGTDPTDSDTDDDSFSDGVEIELGTDPLDSEDYPTEGEGMDFTAIIILVIPLAIVALLIFRKKLT